MKEAEKLKKEQNLLTELFSMQALDKLINNEKGFITDFDGIPIKRREHDKSTEPKPVEIGYKFAEQNVTVETAKYVLKKQFNKQNTEEALIEYDAAKRQEKKKESAPSYLGVNKNNKKQVAQESLADKAAKKIKEMKTNTHRVSLTTDIKGSHM